MCVCLCGLSIGSDGENVRVRKAATPSAKKKSGEEVSVSIALCYKNDFISSFYTSNHPGSSSAIKILFRRIFLFIKFSNAMDLDPVPDLAKFT